MNATAMALAALFPAIVGPLPTAAAAAPVPGLVLELAMCEGGSLRIHVDRKGPAAPATTPCCAKGCHSRRRSRSFDAGQGQ